jgi:hypothetical protein
VRARPIAVLAGRRVALPQRQRGVLAFYHDPSDGEDVDPLLFIEMIPVAETRGYVEHVLSNYWIYRLRDNKRTESLDVLAQGQWPSYLELRSTEEYKIAYN